QQVGDTAQADDAPLRQCAGVGSTPDQPLTQSELLDEADDRRIGGEDVVVELLERARPDAEAGRQAAQLWLAFDERDVPAGLGQPQRGAQSEGATAEYPDGPPRVGHSGG